MPLARRWWASFNSYKTPLMIKPNNRALGAMGKQANLATLVGNTPLSPPAAVLLHGKASHEIFSRLMAPYKFRSLATPEGEVCSPLALVLI